MLFLFGSVYRVCLAYRSVELVVSVSFCNVTFGGSTELAVCKVCVRLQCSCSSWYCTVYTCQSLICIVYIVKWTDCFCTCCRIINLYDIIVNIIFVGNHSSGYFCISRHGSGSINLGLSCKAAILVISVFGVAVQCLSTAYILIVAHGFLQVSTCLICVLCSFGDCACCSFVVIYCCQSFSCIVLIGLIVTLGICFFD